MDRTNFNDGQEIIYQDLNKITSRVERVIFDKVLYELMGRNQNGFFQDSLKVSRVSNTEVSVKAGLGFQLNVTDNYEPDSKPLNLDAASSQIIPTADPTLDRIDIIECKAELVDGPTESRKFKDAGTGLISTTSQVVTKKWSVTFQVTQGTPNASPVAPATTAGYVKLAEVLVEAANGVTADVNITDTRTLLPLSGFFGETGSREYDAVVGDSSLLGVSHETLKAALDDPLIPSGSKILVTRDESLGTIPEVTKNDIEIVFKPKVTFTDSGAGTGLLINASGVKISGGRFVNFTTGINIASGNYNIIEKVRFNTVTTPVNGLSAKNIQFGSIEE